MSHVERAKQMLAEDKIMAILRQFPQDLLAPVSDALIEGGVRSIEITMDYERAPQDVKDLSDRYGDKASIGVGTTWSVEQAAAAADAGATFCVIPGFDQPTCEYSVKRGMLTLPGVQTPCEIQQAIRAGGHIMKLYPADPPGPGYLASIAPAYSGTSFMATGGVTRSNLKAFLDAGAMAAGMTDGLFGDYRDLDSIGAAIAETVRIAQS